MSQPAIIVDGISKRYRLGYQASPHQTFREMAMGLATAPFRKLRSAHEGGAQGEEFWALKDVSFEVQPGEVVGIIGRNGAGKSTLLKILSRITEPTTGQIRMRGRVASLLEVGTGFHPELTGRENIYLNGAILGMKRAEITKKFDEIVAFAETEKFLDTPVKFYSSGMYVRLAFAVAAHLEPEILIVDEVLAVGDAEFQKKCLGKMKEVSEGGGRTVLFVSHNMEAVQVLCSRAALLKTGYCYPNLSPAEAVRLYLSGGNHMSSTIKDLPRSTIKLARPLLAGINIYSKQGHLNTVEIGDELVFKIDLENCDQVREFECGIVVTNEKRQRITSFHSRFQSAVKFLGRETTQIECHVPRLMLPVGKYYVDLAINDSYATLERVEDAAAFHVMFADVFGTGSVPGPEHGLIILPCTWKGTSL